MDSAFASCCIYQNCFLLRCERGGVPRFADAPTSSSITDNCHSSHPFKEENHRYASSCREMHDYTVFDVWPCRCIAERSGSEDADSRPIHVHACFCSVGSID